MNDNDKLSLTSGLWLDLYELAMAQAYFKYRKNQRASFELFIRSKKRPFYVACGIREALDYLSSLSFHRRDIAYLKTLGIFDGEFLDYLKKFKFRGEVWAVDEPEIIFAREPILRVTGNLIEAQIVESALLNTINLYTTLATKALRVVFAAREKKVYDFSLRRTMGKEASLAVARASFVAGAGGTSNVLAGPLYGIPVVGTMAHSFIMSFSSELDSFRAFSRVFPEKTILLIDTYDMKQGLDNAVKVAQELKRNGHRLIGVRIDSGNLAKIAKEVRKELDAQGLKEVIIFASGNLDEYKIKRLLEKGAPIDAFGVGTNMGTSSDLPFSDVIYKLVEVTDGKGEFAPAMKFSQYKLTYPLRKQIYRSCHTRGIMRKDTLGLVTEKIPGRPLLRKVMNRGKILKKRDNVFQQREKLKQKLRALPPELKNIDSSFTYPVLISSRLKKAAQSTRAAIEKRSARKNIVFFDVDTQFDFVDKKGALYVSNAHRLIKTWKKLTGFALKNDIKIISSQDTHSRDDPEFKDFPPHCVRGSRGQKKIPAALSPENFLVADKELSFEELFTIKEAVPQIILEKQVLDVFSNPNTRKLIEAIAPDEVYVYGVATEFCVRCACLGLKKMREKVFVLEDAIREVSPEGKKKTFAEFRKKGIRFVRMVEALRRLSRSGSRFRGDNQNGTFAER